MRSLFRTLGELEGEVCEEDFAGRDKDDEDDEDDEDDDGKVDVIGSPFSTSSSDTVGVE